MIEGTEGADTGHGLWLGVHNRRGVVMRLPDEGGEQEKRLAQMYYQYAAKCRLPWLRTARVLENIAKDYERESHEEDIEADLREDRARSRMPILAHGPQDTYGIAYVESAVCIRVKSGIVRAWPN